MMRYAYEADQNTSVQHLVKRTAELEKPDKEESTRLADSLSADDPASVLDFGSGIQHKIAEFTGSLLNQFKAKDAGDLGLMITELIQKIESASPRQDSAPTHVLARLPLIGALLQNVRRSARNNQTLEAHVETIRAKLDEAYVGLHRDMEMLEVVLKKNMEYFRELEVHIAALLLRLNRAEQEELPGLLRQVRESEDPWAQQRLSEQEAFVRRLEKRLDDFKRTRFLSLSQAPRIRLLQQGQQLVMEKIQTVVYHLIPLWKMDLVTSMAQERASGALELQRTVREHIEEGMRRSARNMREATVRIARESENGMVGMDTLRDVHGELLAALEETRQVYAEGKKLRQEAELELADMERELQRTIAETIRPGA